jgi:hypothetical protein
MRFIENLRTEGSKAVNRRNGGNTGVIHVIRSALIDLKIREFFGSHEGRLFWMYLCICTDDKYC